MHWRASMLRPLGDYGVPQPTALPSFGLCEYLTYEERIKNKRGLTKNEFYYSWGKHFRSYAKRVYKITNVALPYQAIK